MDSIDDVINDSSATQLVKLEDNDVFGDDGSSKIMIDNVEIPSIISLVDPPKTSKYEEEYEPRFLFLLKTLLVMLKMVLEQDNKCKIL